DRPSGRGRRIEPGPVKRAALAHGLPVVQPETLASEEARAPLEAWDPEALVVVAYGLILPREVLALPRFGCVNIHASNLPRWRGAAPIERAILAGDTETGVTIMQMDAGLDTGPVLRQRRLAVSRSPTASSTGVPRIHWKHYVIPLTCSNWRLKETNQARSSPYWMVSCSYSAVRGDSGCSRCRGRAGGARAPGTMPTVRASWGGALASKTRDFA